MPGKTDQQHRQHAANADEDFHHALIPRRLRQLRGGNLIGVVTKIPYRLGKSLRLRGHVAFQQIVILIGVLFI